MWRPRRSRTGRSGTPRRGQGALGVLYPQSGKTRQIPLGSGSAPHGVIVGPDGAPWVTDGGLNAIVRVDPESFEVTRYPLPQGSGYTNLNTAAFDAKRGHPLVHRPVRHLRPAGPATGALRVFDARGRGPGIASTPAGDIYYARSPAATSPASTPRPARRKPSSRPRQGRAHAAWSDSGRRIWVSEWLSGQLAYDPKTRSWQAWKLPGEAPRTYAVYVG